MDETVFAKRFAPMVPHAHWLLRISLAAIFLYHGVQKVTGGPAPQMVDAMFFGSNLVFWLVALGEVSAGVAILAGGLKIRYADWMTRYAGATIFIIMVGAIMIVHRHNGWNFSGNGSEFQTMTALEALWFVVRGNPALHD